VQLILADNALEPPSVVSAFERMSEPAHSLPTLADKLLIDNVILTDSSELPESFTAVEESEVRGERSKG
jgi:hypothetical protein